MQRLLIVSNRLPLTIQEKKGDLNVEPSVGGLATGLRSWYKSSPSIWIGWAGIGRKKIKREKDIMARLLAENCHPVPLSQPDVEAYYHGMCNRTIWPLFHYFPFYSEYSEDFWQAYERVNTAFANVVSGIAKPNDIIWIHDYHLMLLPKLLRERLPKATVGFFLHIPFPSFEIFRLLPWRQQILEGLLGADLVGFHTYDYTGHFLDSVHRLLGYEVAMGQITAADRVVRADAFPMGINYEQFSRVAHDPQSQAERKRFRKKLGDCRVILSVDRLDYTKGIPQRLEAFSLFLDRNPKFKRKVILVLLVVPSRIRVEHYIQLKKQLDGLVGEINGKHGTIGWMPVWYLYRSLPFHPLAALYSLADVALVTPLRDGMNLVAKEYTATKTDGKGVLILSETAGAAQELGEAIIINANNQEEIAQALAKALEMPEQEQIEHNRTMQKRLRRYDVVQWANEFTDKLLSTKKLQREMEEKALTYEMQRELASDFQDSDKALLLLDYDGTLVPFSPKPMEAMPGAKLLRLLEQLTKNHGTEVVLISGRDKDTLEEWFGSLNVGLVAEHGVWIKEKGGGWETIETLTNEWKEEVYPILESWVDRTPGSFIEEKEFSLVWHYRKADPRLGELRGRELINNLSNTIANLNLQVLEGSKIVEVKNTGINKGRAALRWISREKWDFILALGDDWTDEDTFKALPSTAWSIKVGFGASAARFSLSSPSNATSLLRKLVRGR
ncbi:MAG: bifunctional alpha,alpha-trehalose-phosphate synthase (UDP-forming)/trehalose-phosphatase [Chloroflexota bacterium]|nr:bifunctional alpha,alpha-trehalose-phosphate synthase (UDP-forming)/trehalose-phosphatase [Chloroflexota bacterium]